MAERKGYDSTNPPDCPGDGEVYPGYIDGTYADNQAQQKARHPGKLCPSIGRFPTSRADIYDCERGLLTPAQAVRLAAGNVKRGEFAMIYVDESGWPSVRWRLRVRRLLGRVSIFVAWENGGDKTIPSYADARQYLLSPGGSPGHYDVSNWRGYIAGLDGPLPPKAPPLSLITAHLLRRLTRIAERLNHRLGVRLSKGTPVNGHGKTLLRQADVAMSTLQATIRKVIDK